jgi:hypothetical protein
MKRFEDLSDEEVLALDSGKIDFYINLECAHEGVPLLPPAPVAPEKDDVKGDVEVFKVPETIFATKEDAERVAALATLCKRLTWGYVPGPRFDRIVNQTDEPVHVANERTFTPSGWDLVKTVAERFHAENEAFKKEKAEFEKALVARGRVSREIMGRVERVQAVERRRQRMMVLYNKYIDLADGDRKLAAKFLTQAYSEAPELLIDVKELIADQDITAKKTAEAPEIPF